MPCNLSLVYFSSRNYLARKENLSERKTAKKREVDELETDLHKLPARRDMDETEKNKLVC